MADEEDELIPASEDFFKIMIIARGEPRGEWLSLNEMSRITGFSPITISTWSRETGKKRTEPSWRNALIALRRLGFEIYLKPPTTPPEDQL